MNPILAGTGIGAALGGGLGYFATSPGKKSKKWDSAKKKFTPMSEKDRKIAKRRGALGGAVLGGLGGGIGGVKRFRDEFRRAAGRTRPAATAAGARARDAGTGRRKKYLDLVKRFHPDRQTDPAKKKKAEDILKRINQARQSNQPLDAFEHEKLAYIRITALADELERIWSSR